jgi:hypothetical protein
MGSQLDEGQQPGQSHMHADEHWVLDKKIPLALIGAIILQGFVALWWAAGMNNRVEVLERQAVSTAPMSERLVKLETKFDAAIETLAEIKVILRSPRPEQPAH